MKNRGKCFELTILALLASCNAVLELSLGTYLHALKLPMTGSIMVGINLIVYVIGYNFVQKKGTVMTVGFLTCFLTLFLGPFKKFTIIAILLESLIVEIYFSLMGYNRLSLTLASVSSNLFCFFYAVTMATLVLGRGVTAGFLRAYNSVISRFEWFQGYLIGVVVLILLLHAISGLAFAFMAWKMGRLPEMAMGRLSSESATA